jgi:hypothetical protein
MEFVEFCVGDSLRIYACNATTSTRQAAESIDTAPIVGAVDRGGDNADVADADAFFERHELI